MKKTILFFLFFIYLSNQLFADIIYNFPDTSSQSLIGSYLYILEDKDNKFDSDYLLKHDSFFKLSKEKVPNLGISKSNYWLRFSVKNNSEVSDLYIEIEYPTLDYIEFYKHEKKGLKLIEKSGDFEKYKERKYNHQNYIFHIKIPKDSTFQYYFKINTGEQFLLPIYIKRQSEIHDSHIIKELIFGIYAGIIFVMFLYNLFIYISVKDKIYLYYVIYILLVGLTQASLQGYTFRYLWPNSSELAIFSVFFFPATVGIAALRFINVFLHLSVYYKKALFFFYVLEIVYLICIILALFKVYDVSQMLIQINALMASSFAWFVGLAVYKKGYKPAIFFLIAWSIFLIGICLFVLKDFGILPYNLITNYTMQIGSVIEAILLSFALADRINILKKEKDQSQTQALEALRENERIIKEQNIVLEAKVTERTFELKKSNVELTTTLSELKQTQSQLVNAEKMASLGQLTAGIAHEINNPINFVVSNVKPLRRDIEDIYELVQKYETISAGEKDKIKQIEAYKKEIDYDYLKEEIANLLKGVEEGASRTAEIVKGLRVFSRLDETDLKRINITEGIDSTLILLNAEIFGAINLVKNYADLPLIECYPGKMNQVFMNILNNAIYAIKANAEREEKGELSITTSCDKNYVKISIKDNGIGMKEAIKNKVFDPFFTTKDVGKGTGLGMSITFSIINDHKGTIDVNTEYGKGTEFIITLPINQVLGKE